MNVPGYSYFHVGSPYLYIFFSKGTRGTITKLVRITPITAEGLDPPNAIFYNVAFGDLDEMGGGIGLNDSTRTNNGDIRKVMATVVRIVGKFVLKNKNSVLSFSGFEQNSVTGRSSNQRIRLYQKIIDSNWLAVSARYVLWGVMDSHQERYTPGKPYHRILVQCK